jgi:hypothetical protein
MKTVTEVGDVKAAVSILSGLEEQNLSPSALMEQLRKITIAHHVCAEGGDNKGEHKGSAVNHKETKIGLRRPRTVSSADGGRIPGESSEPESSDGWTTVQHRRGGRGNGRGGSHRGSRGTRGRGRGY